MTHTQASKTKDICLIIAIVFIALLFRRYDAFTRPQLWAEDGSVFLQQYEALGIRSLFTPYAGYLHLVPRLTAFVFGSLHVGYLHLPACYNATTFAITCLVAVYLWKCAGLLQLNHKVLFATCFLLLPLGAEMFMNITNIIWITSLYLIAFLFVGYKDTRYFYLNTALLLLCSLNGPFSLLLSPVVALILFIERKQLTTRAVIPLATILLGGIVQLIFIKLNGSVSRGAPAPPEHWHLLRLFTNNISDMLLLESGLFPAMPHLLPTAICITGLCLLAYAVFISYKKIATGRKYVLPLAAALFLGSFIVAFWPGEYAIRALACPRYYFGSYTCMAWLLIAGLDSKIRTPHLCVYLYLLLLHSNSLRSEWPDKQWKNEIQEYEAGKRTDIDINPEGWHVSLPARK